MVDISRKKYERNGIKTMVCNDGILWLNEKHIEGLDHKKLQVTTIKYVLGHRKLRTMDYEYGLSDEPKKTQLKLYIERISNTGKHGM